MLEQYIEYAVNDKLKNQFPIELKQYTFCCFGSVVQWNYMPAWLPFVWWVMATSAAVARTCFRLFICDSEIVLHVQWNLDTASLDTALILLLSQFLIMPDFFPSLSLLIKPQYSVIFTTSILLQHQFFCKPKTFFSYIFQPRYNINLKNGIFTIDKRKW